MPMGDTRHASSGAMLASAPTTCVTEVHTNPPVDPRRARRQTPPVPTVAPTAAEEPSAPSATVARSPAAASPFHLEDNSIPEQQPVYPPQPVDPRVARASTSEGPSPLTSSDDQPNTPLYAYIPLEELPPACGTPLPPSAGAPTAEAPTSTPCVEVDLGAPTAAETPAAAVERPIRQPPTTAQHPLDRDPDDSSLAPTPDDFVNRKLSYSFQGSPLACEALFVKSTPERVIDLIGDSIACEFQFNCSRRQALCILHVLNRGQPPFMRLRPQDDPVARSAFNSTIDRILQSDRDPPLPVSYVADGSESFEILFVPVHDLVAQRGADGTWEYQKVSCFWCYRVVPGAVPASIKWLTGFRLPVVLDLDDTLVVANGEGALRDKRDKARIKKKGLEESKVGEENEAYNSTEQIEIRKKITILKKEIPIIEQDMKMIREYIEEDSLTDENGDVHVAQMESAFTDPTGKEAEIERPVIRMMRGEDYVTVFTRIDPENTSTSMIIRVRAGWEKLKQELMATLDTTGLRKWDTYVCTAAEMRYALEVCRILDPEGDVFNRSSLQHHLVCVSRQHKKSLKAALHHPLDANRYKADASELEDPDDVEQDDGVKEDDQGPSGVPTMSVTIIVDDRIDVWESGVTQQIVTASQFNHYPTAAAHACSEGLGTSRRGHDEVARILNFLTGIRRDLFHFWDNCLNPTVRQLLARGIPNALYATNMHEMMSASPYVNVKSMRPSAALPLPPDSMGSRENQGSQLLAPVDPRKLRALAVQNSPPPGPPQGPPQFALTALQPPQGAPPTAVISLQPVFRARNGGPFQVYPPPLPPPNAPPSAPSLIPYIPAASLPYQGPSTGTIVPVGSYLPPPMPASFSTVPQDPRRARTSNSGVGASASASTNPTPGTISSLPPPAPLASITGALPQHSNAIQARLPPPAVLGAQVKPKSTSIPFQVQPHTGGVPGLHSCTSLPALKEKEESGNNNAAPGMLSGTIKDEDLVNIYNAPEATKAEGSGVKKESGAPSVKKEPADDKEKPVTADSESMDACMELLYGGGEGNTGAGEADASSADTAKEGDEDKKGEAKAGEEEASKKKSEGEGGESDDGEIEGSDEENHAKGDKPTAKDKGTADKDKEQAEQRRRAEASGDKGARQRDEAMSYWNDDTWLGWDDEEEGPTAPADDEESKQRLQEKLWTLGQGGLPFVVVGEDPSKSCYRPLRVQQNPVISSWAPFLKPGDVVPAIAVDPDPAKRPDVIVIRIDQSMVNQTCALNQNYHFMLGDQMQSKFTFTGSQTSHQLPPWVLLDTQSQRHAVTDLHASFQSQHAPMPALANDDIVHRAMAAWHSFYLRNPLPDIPSGGSVDLSAAETASKPSTMTTASANDTIQKLMRAKLSSNHGFRPISLPQDVIQQMVDNETTAADGWFEVGGPQGQQTVAVLHLPVGFGEDMMVHHAMVQTPVAVADRPPIAPQRRVERPGQASMAAAREGSPGVGRQAGSAAKRKRGAVEGAKPDPGSAGFVGAKAARGARRGAAREEERSLLWHDQPLDTNPVSFLNEKAQAMQMAVEFEVHNQGDLIAMDVFWGEVPDPIGSAAARTKKEAKAAAAIDALRFLDRAAIRRPGAVRREQRNEAEHGANWRDRKGKRQGAQGMDDLGGDGGDLEGGSLRRNRENKRSRLANKEVSTSAAAGASTGGYSSMMQLYDIAQAQKTLGTTGYGGISILAKNVTGVGTSTKGYGSSTGGYGAAKQAAAKQGNAIGVSAAAAAAGAASLGDASVRRSARLATTGYGGAGAVGGGGGDDVEGGTDPDKRAVATQGSGTGAKDDSAAKAATNGTAPEKTGDVKATAEPNSEEEDGEILSDGEI